MKRELLTGDFCDCYSNEKLPIKLLSEQCQKDNVGCLSVVKTVLANNLHASYVQATSTQKFTNPSKWITEVLLRELTLHVARLHQYLLQFTNL